MLINSLHRLVSSQIKNVQDRKHFCRRCLCGFTSEEKLTEHIELCNRDFTATMPEEGSVVKFKNANRQMKVSFVVYADFECFVSTGEHVPSSFCYYLKSFDENVLASELVVSETNDIANEFVESITALAIKIGKLYRTKKEMTDVDMESFRKAENCCICDLKLGRDRVRDDCHLIGKYRGAAHKCNVNYKMIKFLPVYFHNMSRYDIHLFVKRLKGKISVIPQTDEIYISISTRLRVSDDFRDTFEIGFLDSFKFMSSSIEMLAKSVTKFDCLSSYFENVDLLKRKGVYPYEWVTEERMNDKELPSIECFY